MRDFAFIDLFAGIGGLRLAFEAQGGKCVFSSEWNKQAQQTYEANFGERPHGDIAQIDPASIPDHDILVAGFPCQPFSIAGVSKKNSLGRVHGFLDKTQGTCFFNVASIIEAKRPRAFLLENVKNLASHDKGKTFETIISTLQCLNYDVFFKVISARNVVPQNRERIYIVGFSYSHGCGGFEFPEFHDLHPKFGDILDKDVPAKYTLSDRLWSCLQAHAKKHKEKGNGFGFGLTKLDGIARTLSARYHKDGSEILVPQDGKNPRRLTPRECARLMGYKDSYKIVCSDTAAYRQFGNSVVVPVVESIAKQVVKAIGGVDVYHAAGRQDQGGPVSGLLCLGQDPS